MEEVVKPKRKYVRKATTGKPLGRPKKAPSNPVARSVSVPAISALMLDIMAILTCQAEGEAKVAALATYRYCKGLEDF